MTKERSLARGCRVEREIGWVEQRVLFGGWRSVEKHTDFAKSEGFVEYCRIKDFVQGFEIKDARLIEPD